MSHSANARPAGKILVVDDDEELGAMLCAALARRGLSAASANSAQSALETMQQTPIDVVVTDLNMSGMSGIELCRRMAATCPGVPVVVITGFGSMETAVESIRAGAWDFITKPFDTDAIGVVIERALKHRRMRKQLEELRQIAADELAGKCEMIGKSPAVTRVRDLVDRVGDTESSVLIMGESGTGKELVARGLHNRSSRRGKPFIAVNCAAMPETLLESELFGHIKGSFTDARASRAGLFVEANGGTLFLDEIGEMPLTMQPKLLRALQERTVRPVGGSVEVPFDVRVITATNRSLEFEIEQKRFREDLYYRVNVVRIDVPPLRARENDTLLLAQYFVDKFAQRSRKNVIGLSEAAAEKLVAYDWPGNVRELENCMECAVTMTRFELIAVDDLPTRVRDAGGSLSSRARDAEEPLELVSMDEIERRYINRVIKAVGGNKSQAATVLGFDRRTLYRKLKQYSVDSVDSVDSGDSGDVQDGGHASVVAGDAFVN